MTTSLRTRMWALCVALGLLITAWVPPVLAQERGAGPAGVPPPKGVHSTVVPPAQLFSCGVDAFTTFSVGISTHGNVVSFISPAGVQNIGSSRTGFGLCTSSFAVDPPYYDFGGTEIGWSGAAPLVSQPYGPNTFPLRITRTTADGAYTVLREISGNSFVLPYGGALIGNDLNGNHVLCDTLVECGNCTNRTLHVLTRVTKNTSGSAFVQIIEAVDFDAGFNAINTWAHTSASVIAFESKAAIDGIDATEQGMLLQAVISPSNPSKYPFAGEPFPGDCLGGTFGLDGTVVGDNEAYLRTPFGTLAGPGGHTGNLIRSHYRRF